MSECPTWTLPGPQADRQKATSAGVAYTPSKRPKSMPNEAPLKNMFLDVDRKEVRFCAVSRGQALSWPKGSLMREYVPIEYPKWIDGVLVRNAVEENARLDTLAKAAEATRAAELARPPSPAGIRMRRTRERRREGRLSVRCEISTVQIESLVEAGFIDPVRRNDATEVAQGVGRSLDGLIRSVQGATT